MERGLKRFQLTFKQGLNGFSLSNTFVWICPGQYKWGSYKHNGRNVRLIASSYKYKKTSKFAFVGVPKISHETPFALKRNWPFTNFPELPRGSDSGQKTIWAKCRELCFFSVYLCVCLQPNVTTKMTAVTMGSFHGFGTNIGSAIVVCFQIQLVVNDTHFDCPL